MTLYLSIDIYNFIYLIGRVKIHAEIYLYLIIRDRRIMQNISVIPFARIMGMSEIKIPYKSHRNIPNVNMEYIPRDRSFVCLVLMVFTA
jgi:hypothetical protein